MSREGTKGGSLPPLDVKLAQSLFEFWDLATYGWVQATVLTLAGQHGEFHADHMADVDLDQPNQIGAAVNALASKGILEKRNKLGEVEHRKGTSPAAHGRLSYVWRLTPRGVDLLRRMPPDTTRRKHLPISDGGTLPPPVTPGHVPLTDTNTELF